MTTRTAVTTMPQAENGRTAGADEVAPLAKRPSVLAGVRIDGVVVGRLVGFDDDGAPLVTYSGQPVTRAMTARTVTDLRREQIGTDVVLQFEGCDAWRPLIMGCVRSQTGWPLADRPTQVRVDVDGERLTIDAKHEITLRCGKASITLTRAGKVLIRGEYVLSRSSGVNRIKGGSVQIN